MTVGEVIDALSGFDRSLTVYVPGLDRKAEVAVEVSQMLHCGTEEIGVYIPHDVCILPQDILDELKKESDLCEQ
jgi:hypothetical protein